MSTTSHSGTVESTYPYPAPDSSVLAASPLPPGLQSAAIRTAYLRSPTLFSPPPLIACSPFIPHSLAEHLMRKKRPTAIGEKFIAGSAITNLEGAAHTFVTAVLPIEMHGDYVYRNGHQMSRFPPGQDGKSQIRRVLLSTQIHLDFEMDGADSVALQLYQVGSTRTTGEDLGEDFSVLDVASKQAGVARTRYDNRLRRHLVFHLTLKRTLPSSSEVASSPYVVWSVSQAIKELSTYLLDPLGGGRLESLANNFVRTDSHSGEILSLEMLQRSYVESLTNEFRALELMCSHSSRRYIYTYDPPSIFAQFLDPDLLNRLMVHALKQLLRDPPFPDFLQSLSIFAFNAYADPSSVIVLQKVFSNTSLALSYSHVQVIAKSSMFRGLGGTAPGALIDDLSGVAGAALVLHNNSDGFGQNIEFESDYHSLDGAIGCNSNAAVGLRRERPDLLDFLV